MGGVERVGSRSPLRILNIMQCTNLGGMEQASLRLMNGLKERGHCCRVVSVNPLGALRPLLENHDIPAVGVPYLGKYGWRSHFRLRRAIDTEDFDALLMTGPTLSGMLAVENVRAGRRVLAVHFHHTGVKPTWAWRELYRLAVKRFEAIVFPSDFIRREAEAIFPEVARRSITIRNPLPLPSIPDPHAIERAKAELKIPRGVFVVGNAGWLIPRKRFDVFLRVARKILAGCPETVFLVAGDGPERTNLMCLAKNLGLEEAVRWMGWRDDLRSFYSSLDVLLFNSDWDAFGMTPVEAMSYGVPVVASLENGGLGEIISEERYGILITKHDEDLLSERVLELLHDPKGAKLKGIMGRRRIAEICSDTKCFQAYETLLTGNSSATC
jgi:glycosyltransferase involved in cell wall biosynthesis